MKPSERLQKISDDDPADAWSLPHPSSSLADPPISVAEAQAAETATCRWHHGHISHTRVTSDAWGKVYFCPIGRQYWRLNEWLGDFLKPLVFK